MNDLKEIINNLCKSEFLPDWILKLKENERLFSPKINIKPCVKIDDNHVRSSVWDGLLLIDCYCRRNIENSNVDNFIVSLINESIKLYESDKEEAPYLKLNSSNIILQLLLEILLSKPKFVNETKFVSFVEIYLNGVLSWPFSLVYDLYMNRNVLVNVNPNVIFLVYKTIVEKRNNKNDYDKYLIVPELISLNPLEYYNYSKEVILSFNNKFFYDMSSFNGYKSHSHQYEITYFEWLKIASKKIDTQVLKKDILFFINSSQDLFKKIGLCLLNISFDRFVSLFFENFSLFVNDESFYADLRIIFNEKLSSDLIKTNLKLIQKTLNEATFGCEKDSTIMILKNHLYGILNKKINIFPYMSEKTEQIDFVNNFNKKIYSVNYDSQEEENRIYDKIKDMDINDAIDVFHKMIGGSYYFDDVIHNSFRRYIHENFYNDLDNYIEKFDSGLLIHLIHYYSNDSKNLYILIRLLKKSVFLISTNEFNAATSSVLFALKQIYNQITIDELTEIVNNIDYNILSVDEYEYYDRIVTICINENIHSYLDIVIYLCECKSISVIKLEEIITCFIKKYDCKKLKSIIASIYPKLLYLDFEYGISLENYIFDNIHENHNLSYPLISISNYHSIVLLDRISSQDKFIEYIKMNESDNDIQMSKQVILSWYLKSYIFDDKYDNIIDLLFECKKYDVILENMRTVNYWIQKHYLKKDNINRYYKYLENFDKSFTFFEKDEYESDQFIREIANSMVLLNESKDFLWGLIFKMFRNFNHYFSDECVELIKKYKDNEIQNISKLLDLYFDKYDRYMSFEDTVVEVFNIIKPDKNYKDKIKKWQVALTKKNIDIKSKIC